MSLSVGNDVIQPVKVVRDLGVYLNNELTMKQHISRVVSSCFFQLRRVRQIRRFAGEEVTKRLVMAFVLSDSTTAMLYSQAITIYSIYYLMSVALV